MHERKEAQGAETEQAPAAPGLPALAASTPPERVLALQRTIGNAAVTRLIGRAGPDAGTAAAPEASWDVEQVAKFFPEGSISRRLVYHYGAGTGKDYVLTEDEMREIKPYINFFDANRFGKVAGVAARQRASQDAHSTQPPLMPAVVDVRGLGVSQIGGGLGTFTVHLRGDLTLEDTGKGDKRIDIDGSMSFYDEWDFDPKPLQTLIGASNRTKMGEAKTIVGATMSGKPFKVTSPTVPVRQSSGEPEATW